MTDTWICWVAAGTNALAAVANVAAASVQTSRFAASGCIVAAVLFTVSAAIWIHMARS